MTTYNKTGSLQVASNLTGDYTGGTGTVYGRPVVGDTAEELYEILKPIAYQDEALGWPLLLFCETICSPLDLVRDYGENWGQLLDVDVAPSEALGWLSQFVGSILVPQKSGESDADFDTRTREFIRATPQFSRGTLASMEDAIQQHLTGTKTVIIRERNGGPYKLVIRTKTSETPSTADVLDAIATQKPAGLTLDYTTLTGQDYQQVFSNYATYQDLYNAYATYNGVFADLPGA